MANIDLATLRAAKAYAKQDYDKQMGFSGGDSIDGIPTAVNGEVTDWGTPQGWESFRASAGFYPFGMQKGAMVMPGNAASAPEWAKRMMGGHLTPAERLG